MSTSRGRFCLYSWWDKKLRKHWGTFSLDLPLPAVVQTLFKGPPSLRHWHLRFTVTCWDGENNLTHDQSWAFRELSRVSQSLEYTSGYQVLGLYIGSVRDAAEGALKGHTQSLTFSIWRSVLDQQEGYWHMKPRDFSPLEPLVRIKHLYL